MEPKAFIEALVDLFHNRELGAQRFPKAMPERYAFLQWLERFETYVAKVATLPPEGNRAARTEWLYQIESLDKASWAITHLDRSMPWIRAAANIIREAVSNSTDDVQGLTDPWWYTRIAQHRRAEYRERLMPWDEIGSATRDGVIDDPTSEQVDSLLQAWFARALCDEDVEKLLSKVSRKGPWADAYLEYLHKHIGRVQVTLFDPKLEILPTTIREIRLPHRGRDAHITVTAHEGGTRWCLYGTTLTTLADIPTKDVPKGTTSFDPISLSIPLPRIHLDERAPTEAEQMRRVVTNVQTAVDDHANDGSYLSEALNIVSWLKARAHRLEETLENAPRQVDPDTFWVSHLIEARHALERFTGPSHQTWSDPLRQALAELDAAFQPYERAGELLPEDFWDRIHLCDQDTVVPSGAWWSEP